MKSILSFALAALFATASMFAGSPLPAAATVDVGLSPERLARVGQFVEHQQRERRLAGAVTVIARRGKLVEFEARGFADIEAKRLMRTDDIFAIASMTKPVAAVAVLVLLEEQRLLLSDPLEKYLPEFREMKVAVAKPDAPDGYVLEPANRSITILDLLTQRAGFPGFPQTDGPAAGLRRGKMRSLPPDVTLAEYVSAVATLPLDYQPGTAWRYGGGFEVLGRVIEVASGKSLDVFLQERIFAPLLMTDTGFVVPTEKRARLVPSYSRSPEGELVRSEPRATARSYPSAGGGLFSTPGDYLRFCQMLLNGGQLDGVRLLSRKSVELMTAPHVDSIPLWFLPGQQYGLGVAVQADDGASGLISSPGTYGWSGAHNTYFRIDPKEQLILMLFVQLNPANVVDLQYGFHNAAMQAIVD